MKKHPLILLCVITGLFAAFLFGFFIGRNQNHESIMISSLPAEPVHNIAPPTVADAAEKDISFPIDLNKADLQELTALPGIGDTLAQRIIDYRAIRGRFERPEELLNVEGIGSNKLEALLDYVTTGG